MSDTKTYEKFIQSFIADHGKWLQPADKEELYQDIFVALLEEDPKSEYTEYQINLTAQRVLAEFRHDQYKHRHLLLIEDPTDTDHNMSIDDKKTPNLDLRLDIEAELSQLPPKLRVVAEDFLYRGMTQEAVAEKYGKTQAWASKTKAKLRKLLSNLRERK